MTLRDLQERGCMNGNKGPKPKISKAKVRYEPSQEELDRIHAEKLEQLRIKGIELLTPEEKKKYA